MLRYLPYLFFAALLWCGVAAATGKSLDPHAYAGSERCRECHQKHYDGWRETFHSTVVQDAKKNPESVLGDFSASDLPFTLDDVEFTIGGHWDQRYLKRIGDDLYVLPRLWNIQSQEWQHWQGAEFTWKRKPYSKYCKGCHVTAYDPEANVTYAESRVGCEACHGPGWVHAESGGDASVVNPQNLPQDRRDMICAACHVRGKDISGTYHFPVGYVPGEDLGRYYVPYKTKDGETNSQAISRQFADWRAKRESSEGVQCDVCQVPWKKQAPTTGIEYCFSCHNYRDEKRDNYSEHTHHSGDVDLGCSDCHLQKTKDIVNPGGLDIHSYGYFLLHAEKCYDTRIHRACVQCHDDRSKEWARKVVEGWREPVQLDH